MWKIWYVDNEVEGESFDDWVDYPDEGIVAIYHFYGRGEDGVMRGLALSGTDWYWMTPDGIIAQNSDTTYEVDYWVDVDLPENAVSKKGKWVSDERMYQVNNFIAEIIES